MSGSAPQFPARTRGVLRSETMSAKEDKDILEMPGKTPRLMLTLASTGLQCGLSGTPVII